MTAYPTREEWAIQRTTVYSDMDNPNPASRVLSDYASAEEVEAAITAIKDSYKDFGRQMKVADEQKKWDLKCRRKAINLLIKQMIKDRVPHGYELFCAFRKPPYGLPALERILERYRAAEQAALEDWERRVAATPVNDAAWQQELERRKDIERYLKGKGLVPYYS